jgi:single-strand DNA-binding protein
MSLNVCTFSGRLGRDAESKVLPNGTAVLEFSIAVDVGFGDSKTTFWLRCSLFGERGAKLAQYLAKGQLVAVSGEFNAREYPSGGAKKTSLELRVDKVELLGRSDNAPQRAPDPERRPAAKPAADPFDDDIPF